MFKKLRNNQAIYQILLRFSGASQLILMEASLWDEADLPVHTAGLLLAGACIPIVIFTKIWSGIAIIGASPVIIHMQGLDGLLCLVVFSAILVEGSGTSSIDAHMAERRSRDPPPGS